MGGASLSEGAGEVQQRPGVSLLAPSRAGVGPGWDTRALSLALREDICSFFFFFLLQNFSAFPASCSFVLEDLLSFCSQLTVVISKPSSEGSVESRKMQELVVISGLMRCSLVCVYLYIYKILCAAGNLKPVLT